MVPLRQRELEARKYEEMTNVAAVIFKFEGEGTDDQLVKALDKKYDALMDKLLLESLQKQLGKSYQYFCRLSRYLLIWESFQANNLIVFTQRQLSFNVLSFEHL